MTSLVVPYYTDHTPMHVVFLAAFIAILGLITLMPSDIGREVVRKTESFVAHPTNTPLPTSTPTAETKTASASPTIHIQPIIRHDDNDEEEEE